LNRKGEGSQSSEAPPQVSVIVPNYNHARFLPQRLDSVFDQTFNDMEVIILDDASTDNSREVIQRYINNSRVQVSFNEVNSGSPFAQWNRGVALAKGEFVWIAESDDVADPDLLGRLVDVLSRNPPAGLAYCQSRRIDGAGHPSILAEENLRWLHPSRWLSDFVADGRNECRLYLSRMNTIANASAVVFRKSVFNEVGGADESFQICGDWHLWCRMLACSDLAFVAAPLNQHRLHLGSVRSKTVAARSLIENSRVLVQTHELVKLPRWILREALRDLRAKCVFHLRTGAVSRQDLARIARVSWPLDPCFLPRLGTEWLRQLYALRKKREQAERKTRAHTDRGRERDIYFLFRDSPLRQTALHTSPDHPARYSLYGMDVLAERGWHTGHNLDLARRQGRICHWSGFLMDRTLCILGGSSGDFASILASLHAIRSSGLVVSTVDSLGVPLLWLRRLGMFFTPIVYVSIGFPERLQKMSPFWQGVYKRLLRQASAVVAYGFEEADILRQYMESARRDRVHFVPFGANTRYFNPGLTSLEPGADILSVGADPQRDFCLLIELARRHPEWSFAAIASGVNADLLKDSPPNMTLYRDLSLEDVRAHMISARLIVLPVKENTYSGATTTLLQAMAMAKPIVISRVGAIREGYGLRDGENCLLVKPGDIAGFGTAIDRLLSDRFLADRLGQGARAQVVSSLSWDNYVNGMMGVIEKALEKPQTA
jgi:glycosyltransferase involved in cell wall biosynthesis